MDEKLDIKVPTIDTLLEGGIEKGVVTEIYGAAGTGKTNFVIQSAARVLSDGGRVVIIDTEGISYSRMSQIFGEHYQEYLKNIRVNRPNSFEKQLESVRNLGPLLEKLGNVGLVAIDSINMYIRLEYDNPESCNSKDPNREFVKMMIALQQLSREYNIPVVITSQVYSSKANGVEPFSGKSMSHIVKSIFLLRKTGSIGEREMLIKKHRSILSDRKCKFMITGRGLE